MAQDVQGYKSKAMQESFPPLSDFFFFCYIAFSFSTYSKTGRRHGALVVDPCFTHEYQNVMGQAKPGPEFGPEIKPKSPDQQTSARRGPRFQPKGQCLS